MRPLAQTKTEAGDFPASSLAEALPLSCNTDDEQLYANIRACVARGHDIIRPVRPHEGVALIVGGGPSVRKDIEEIRARKAQRAIVFALNGAGLWLQENGIVPDALIVLDARPHNARFVADLDRSVLLLLASQCDAAVFEAGREHAILAWHPSMNGNSGVVENRQTVLIGGSTTVGMRALRIVHVLGFRQAHLYGYDSSVDAVIGECHAYPQDENGNDLRTLREVEVAGEMFYAPPWMIRQADDFRLIASGLMAEGLAIHVHGDGLLPTIAREMGKVDRIENAACYDLEKQPASFDFVTWLIVAEMDRRRRGAPKPLMVHFRHGSGDGFRVGDVQNVEEKQRLLDHVMRPALALVGAVESEKAADGYRYRYWYKAITQAHERGEDVPHLVPPIANVMQVANWLADHTAMRPIVITLREARYWPQRNSTLTNWIEFAKRRRKEGHAVVFVRDTDQAHRPMPDGFLTCPKASTDLWTRTALYKLAKCNLAASCGPVTLLQFSDAPYLQFNLPYGGAQDDPAWWTSWLGFAPPGNFPWAGPHQMMIWERDDLDVIEGAWARWLEATQHMKGKTYAT